jgi:hypothetical protein
MTQLGDYAAVADEVTFVGNGRFSGLSCLSAASNSSQNAPASAESRYAVQLGNGDAPDREYRP